DEVVLVVDGPVSDQTNDVISCFQKKENFKAIFLEQNMGHGIARSISIDNCSNDLVAICDADDINDIHRFEKQLQIFENFHKIDVVGSNILLFTETIDN